MSSAQLHRILFKADEPVTGGEPAAVEPAPIAPSAPAAAEPVIEAPAVPAAAPWAADRDTFFTDPDAREAFDRYMREKSQPYVTKLEQEKAELSGKAWVYDGLSSDDPSETIREILEQVYDPDVAARVHALISAGVDPEEAGVIAEAEEAAKPAVELAALPPEVKAAVEYAKTAQEREAAAEAAAAAQKELDAATVTYDAWRKTALEANPDIPENDLHAYVYAAEGDMEQGLANYRATHPKPAADAPAAPPTLGGQSLGGISESRQASSLGDAFGDVYDAAHTKHTTI